MTDLDKEYIYLIEKAFGSNEEDDKDFDEFLKETGGFVRVEEEHCTLSYYAENGEGFDIDMCRLRESLASAGILEEVKYPATGEGLLDEAARKIYLERFWNPFYDYLKKLRAEIAANKNFDPSAEAISVLK